MKVLIVENGEQTSDLVRHLGHLPLSASSIATALKKAHAINPDMLLVDLTQLNGTELARQLREHGHKTPLVGLTGYMDGSQRQAAIDAGFEEFLARPYRPNELAGILRRIEARLKSRTIAERQRVVAQLEREMSGG